MSKKVCETCRHFHEWEEQIGSGREGWCLRYPPVYVGREYDPDCVVHCDPMEGLCWSEPVVGIYSTCGEWKKVKHGKSN